MIKSRFFLFTSYLLLIILGISSISSCEKEPVTIYETITVIDTIVINNTVVDTVTIEKFIQDTFTTFILVRHAETDGSASNPSLSDEGIARSERLAEMLKSADISGVYSSDYNRTKESALPTANLFSLTTTIYNPSSSSSVVQDVYENHLYENVLIVGHSNTIPKLANYLLGENVYSKFDESSYDNLLILNVSQSGHAEIVHLKY